jgi:hypothetical protein
MMTFALGACGSPTGSADVRRTPLYVEAFTVDCMGIAPQKCLLVREDPADSWEYHYDGITGFTYEPGYRYTLEVEIRKIRNPPADASSLEYRLVRVIDKVAVQ